MAALFCLQCWLVHLLWPRKPSCETRPLTTDSAAVYAGSCSANHDIAVCKKEYTRNNSHSNRCVDTHYCCCITGVSLPPSLPPAPSLSSLTLTIGVLMVLIDSLKIGLEIAVLIMWAHHYSCDTHSHTLPPSLPLSLSPAAAAGHYIMSNK